MFAERVNPSAVTSESIVVVGLSNVLWWMGCSDPLTKSRTSHEKRSRSAAASPIRCLISFSYARTQLSNSLRSSFLSFFRRYSQILSVHPNTSTTVWERCSVRECRSKSNLVLGSWDMLCCPTVRAGIRQRSIITNGWLGDTNEREFTRTEDQPWSGGGAAAEFRKE